MEKYSKIINDYITSKDTDVKRLMHQRKIESKSSTELFIDDILFKCGIITATIVLNLDSKNKYQAYLNFSKENIFHEKGGIRELINNPVSEVEAQKILAKTIIELLENVNYDKFRARIS